MNHFENAKRSYRAFAAKFGEEEADRIVVKATGGAIGDLANDDEAQAAIAAFETAERTPPKYGKNFQVEAAKIAARAYPRFNARRPRNETET